MRKMTSNGVRTSNPVVNSLVVFFGVLNILVNLGRVERLGSPDTNKVKIDNNIKLFEERLTCAKCLHVS